MLWLENKAVSLHSFRRSLLHHRRSRSPAKMSGNLYQALEIDNDATPEQSRCLFRRAPRLSRLTVGACSSQGVQETGATDTSRQTSSRFHSRRQSLCRGAVSQRRSCLRHSTDHLTHVLQVNNAYEVLIDPQNREVSPFPPAVGSGAVSWHAHSFTTRTVSGRRQTLARSAGTSAADGTIMITTTTTSIITTTTTTVTTIRRSAMASSTQIRLTVSTRRSPSRIHSSSSTPSLAPGSPSITWMTSTLTTVQGGVPQAVVYLT